MFLLLISVGYIFWTILSLYNFYQNPKDKSFAIYKYKRLEFLLISFFYIINIIGTVLMVMALVKNFIDNANNNEQFKNFKSSLLYLKIGFILNVISNSYYYGHYMLSLIFRPIALEYAPAKLKQYCIRSKRNIPLCIYL